MGLLEDFSADIATAFDTDTFGVAARCSPAAGGAMLEGTVILEEGNAMDLGAMGSNPAAVATIRALDSQFPDPQIDDVFTITASGDVWRVARVMSRGSGVNVLECVREGRMGMNR